MSGRRIEIRGTVQGVGFRPWVYRLARQKGIRGTVRNAAHGVTIEAFGADPDIESFLMELRYDAPPPAKVVELHAAVIPDEEATSAFAIESSDAAGSKALSIPPDLATCPACQSEVFDPSDRRHRYAFTNCTHCGPRFTIATGIPYDRASTTMASFEMCPACKREYDDVEDRRFHAQPNACPACGPQLFLEIIGAQTAPEGDVIEAAAALLNEGAVIAVKGLGGFHLACDATSSESVRRLRDRKHRDEKPFAVMIRDLEAARSLAVMSGTEEALLCSPERPIVLVKKRSEGPVAQAVSPETPLLGLFLPYTPLHHLLIDAVRRPLVMTSANVSDEPICKDNDEARDRLNGIADALLLHDRDIAMRCDDSVARVIAGAPTMMRRSRGFVPRPFILGKPLSRPILACGAHLKNSFCLARGDTAYFGPHIGDLETVAALGFFEEAVERMQSILDIDPEIIAHDLHPGYLSTRYALARHGLEHVGVQHHHAHAVSAMAEHSHRGPVLGLAFDGTGLGDDGTAWGGEFLLCSAAGFERLATFRPIRLPGGNLAMHEIWRIAYALLHDAFDGSPPTDRLDLFRSVPKSSIRVVGQMLERGVNAPMAHGVGRYFDAFGSLALARPISSYEGQVAIAWDFAAEGHEEEVYPFDLDRSRNPVQIDLRPATRAAVEDLFAGTAPGRISSRFHGAVAHAAVAVTQSLMKTRTPVPIVLTGGVFHNVRLVSTIEKKLSKDYEVLRHREVPPGDGGIALGQALIADAFLGDKDRCP
ncbi:MAG: carbamoyltransferase HypF [Myxococcales bacterium]|jgi:hydrogenase maturation protein HypF